MKPGSRRAAGVLLVLASAAACGGEVPAPDPGAATDAGSAGAGSPVVDAPANTFDPGAVHPGDTVILVDTGKPLSARLSAAAHAGCLSFELSSGRNRFIVNSGSPRFAGERLRQLARTTAAHTTVCIGDVSSARIANSPRLGPIMVSAVSRRHKSRNSPPQMPSSWVSGTSCAPVAVSRVACVLLRPRSST